MQRIFQPFEQADNSVTRKYGGTGLGLPISHTIALLMQGAIEVESTPGEGSCFHFHGWFNRAANAHAYMPRAKGLAGKRVLLCGASERGRELLRQELEGVGLQVTPTHAVEEVEALLAQAEQADSPFELLMLDVVNGPHLYDSLLQRIQNRTDGMAELAILLVADSAQQRKVHLPWGKWVLNKPVRRDRLHQTLVTILQPESRKVEPPSESARPNHESLGPNARMRVLVAEDNPVNQKLAQAMLTKIGCDVVLAGDGEEAMAIFDSDPRGFELILMDIQMPVVDGFTATQKLRDQGHEKIPIIAMTANTMKGDREACLAAGMNDYIAKPISRNSLIEIVQYWGQAESSSLERSPSSDAMRFN